MKLLTQFETLHEQAIKATNLDDFGTPDYVEPMKLLLSTYDKGGRLNALAEQMTSGAMTGLLTARLLAQQGLKTHPQFANAAIEKPIIIVGMPRTGSTALHHLLAKDPECQWLAPWLGNTPMPRPKRETWEANPAFQMTVQGLEQFYQVFDGLVGMHPVLAAEPDECSLCINQTGWSAALAGLGAFGDYSEWMTNADARYAYRYHRKLLGLIAGGDRRRWLLKDPTTHSFAMPALLETFPDARIVCTHRDPVTALSSVSDMIYCLRRVREPGLSSAQNGRDQLSMWGPAAGRMQDVLDTLPPERVFDMHIDELQADPVGVATRIYGHFNLPVSDAARAAWTHHAGTNARSGHAPHHYTVESCGFNASDVDDAIGSYGERYRRQYGMRKSVSTGKP